MLVTKSLFKNGRFFNTEAHKGGPVSLLKVLRWKLTTQAKVWPKQVANTYQPELPSQVEPNEAFFTFVNHATVLIQLERGNILTDPVFSDIAGPYGWLGPKRVRPPGLALNKLPKIHTVLISHNHYDHLDLPSLQALEDKDQPLFVVPLGNGSFLRRKGLTQVVELDWWEQHHLETGLSLSLTPAQHWSRRGLLDFCKMLWGGFLIQSPKMNIFFAGDTGYSDHFKEIREKYGEMDVSLLPIGAYEPRWLMKDIHMNPAEAIQAHGDLGSALSIGIHFGTFRLTDEGIDDPVIFLKERLPTEVNFVAPEQGQTISYRTASRKISSNLASEKTCAASLAK